MCTHPQTRILLLDYQEKCRDALNRGQNGDAEDMTDHLVKNDEIEAANSLFDEYEDVAVANYVADSNDETERILHDAEVDEPAKIVDRVENITPSTEGCRNLAD